MKSMYKLTAEYQALMEVEEWTKEHDVLLDELAGDLEVKAENICKLLAELKGDIESFKAEEKRIAARRKQLENSSSRLKDYLQQCLESADIDNIKAGTFKVRIQANNPSVQIVDEELIPEEYFVTVVDKRPSKMDIADEFRSGNDVPGCEFKSSGYSLRIA